MASEQARLGHWKNGSAEREYSELYAALRREAWPGVQECDVATPFGTTHVFAWPGAGTPIVLLHGAGTSSLMWAPLIEALPGRRIYALDGIGEPGLSEQTAPITGGDDLVTWLTAVLDGLALDSVHLVGASYGGWIACNTARRCGARVRTLSLTEPALTPVRPAFWIHSIQVAFAFTLPPPLRRRALRRLHMRAIADADPRVTRMGRLGLMKYRRGVPRGVTPMTDEEFAQITAPTLVLLGAHSELHDAQALLARMLRHMPDARGELVADAGHSLPLECPEVVARAVEAFTSGASR